MTTTIQKMDLLEEWHKQVDRSRYAHYSTARSFRRWNYMTGGSAIILAAIVGSAVFSSYSDFSPELLGVNIPLFGLFGVLITVLTTLQTFLGFSGNAEKHRAIAARYGQIRREIEVALEKLKDGADVVDVEFSFKLVDMEKDIEKRMDDLGGEAPTVPPRIWNKACKQFDMWT